MPTFKLLGTQATCQHANRFVCATETIKNLTTDEIRTTTYHQCKSCGYVEAKIVRPKEGNRV